MEWINSTAAIINAVAVMAGVLAAWKGFGVWRTQMMGQRKYIVAEEILCHFLKAREAIGHVRNPGIRENEKVKGEFITLTRLKKYTQEFEDLKWLKYKCHVHFGKHAAAEFGMLLEVYRDIANAAHLLKPEDVSYPDPIDHKTREKCEAIVWNTYVQPDAIDARLEAAWQKLDENYCRKHLS